MHITCGMGNVWWCLMKAVDNYMLPGHFGTKTSRYMPSTTSLEAHPATKSVGILGQMYSVLCEVQLVESAVYWLTVARGASETVLPPK